MTAEGLGTGDKGRARLRRGLKSRNLQFSTWVAALKAEGRQCYQLTCNAHTLKRTHTHTLNSTHCLAHTLTDSGGQKYAPKALIEPTSTENLQGKLRVKLIKM